MNPAHYISPLFPRGLTSKLGLPEQPLSRRESALARYEVLEEDHEHQIRRRVRAVYEDAEVTKGMERWADTALNVNPARDIVRALACVYKRPAIRQFTADGPEESTRLDEAWGKVHKLAATNRKLKEVNKLAYGIGPVAVIPTVRAGRPAIEFHPPHRYEPYWPETDPFGPPELVVIDLRPGFRLYAPFQRTLDPAAPSYAIVDRETWRYFNGYGLPIAGPDGLDVVEHGVVDADGDPVCPVTFFRVDEPSAEDWWRATRGSRLYGATIAAAVHWCRWHYVRQYQDGKQIVARIPQESEIAEGGVIGHPAKPVEIRGSTAAAAAIEAVDYCQGIDDFLRTINAVISAAALGEGLPPEAVTLSAPLDAGKMVGTRLVQTSVTDDLRSQHRNDQIEYAADWETTFAVRMVGTLRAHDHRLASDLPPLDEVEERHMVEWPELTTSSSAKDQREQDEFDLKHGLKSRVDLVRARFPWMSRSQALDYLKRNAAEDAEVFEILTRTNQPRDPAAQALVSVGDSPSPAQANGAMGPMIRDGQKESPDDDDE